MNYELKNSELTVSISDVGAELKSVRSRDGFEYVCNGNVGEWKYRAPLLFPICGRLKNARYTLNGKEYDMGIHGFARDNRFDVRERSNTEIVFTLTENESTLAAYPFSFRLTVTYSLSGRALSLKVRVENSGSRVLPYMFGWHPGFALSPKLYVDDYCLDMGIDRVDRLESRENGDGTFTRYADSIALPGGCYKLSEESLMSYETTIFQSTARHVTLKTDKDNHALRLSWSDNLRYLCVWKWPLAEAKFLCLEPWTELPTVESLTDDFGVKKMTRMEVGGSEEYCYLAEFI